MLRHIKVQYNLVDEVNPLPHYAYIPVHQAEAWIDALVDWVITGKLKKDVVLVEDAGGRELYMRLF